MLPNSLHIIADALLLVADGEPLDEFSCMRSGAFADILKSFVREGCRFQAAGQQSAHHVVGEEFHAAIGVVNDKPLPRAPSLYEMTSDRMASSLARPPALRMTCASPSASPAHLAGSSRASMQVRMAKCRAGGMASFALSPKSA